MIPVVYAAKRHYIQESVLSRTFVLGVKAIRDTHPAKAILIQGVTDELNEADVSAGAFPSIGLEDVYITDPSGTDLASAALDPAVALHAIARNDVAVYAFDQSRFQEITAAYAAKQPRSPAPRRVDAGSRLYSYLLGPEWLKLQDNSRWMPGSASLTLAGPTHEGESLMLSGYCWDEQLKRGPLHVTVSMDRLVIGQADLKGPETQFRLLFRLPPVLIGHPLTTVRIAVDPVIRAGGRDYGLIFGMVALVSDK